MKLTVDRETALKMARAAQIDIPPKEADAMTDSINDILDFCALVGELDTEGTPDFAWTMIERASRRDDTVQIWDRRDEFMRAAPTAEGDMFRVPRIIREDRGHKDGAI